MNTSNPQPAPALTWQFATFAELQVDALYAVLALRQAVFVVEQACIFPDIDDHDQRAFHLLGWLAQPPDRVHPQQAQQPEVQQRLVAYLRCLPPGEKFVEASIGRVVTAAMVRGTGMGRRLMTEGVRRADALYPGQPIRIGAQLHLERFYESFGFQTVSAPYDEDAIMHVEMLRGGQP